MGLINIFKPLSTLLARLIDLSNVNHFSSEKVSATLGIHPGAAGSGSKCANDCAILI